MQHFKDFLIKLQTLDVKIKKRKAIVDGLEREISYYDLSHQNPFLNAPFKNELKELKELAITDILNLQREQIIFQLQRLSDVKALFSRFWNNYYDSNVPRGTLHLTEYFYSLNLDSIFIAPHSYFADHAIADDNLINDLEDSIRARENSLKEFEEAVSKAIDLPKETEKSVISPTTKKEIKATPVFKEEIVQELFTIIKNYFSLKDQELLLKLLTENEDTDEPLLFKGPGNQLADAFKQLYLSNLIISCNKTELESWIQTNFRYRDKGVQKQYTQKYLQDIISSNTKECQSPLFNVKKSEGQFYLSVLHRNDKNQKR